MYKLNNTESITRISDGASIPKDTANTDYARYLEWIAEGNTPDPYVPPVPTYAELRAKAYPKLEDQLDALWKGGQPQADMKIIIDGVKATYPKV
jgi:hypothetical protein